MQSDLAPICISSSDVPQVQTLSECKYHSYPGNKRNKIMTVMQLNEKLYYYYSTNDQCNIQTSDNASANSSQISALKCVQMHWEICKSETNSCLIE